MTDTTKVMKCTCKHEYQDKHYGKDLRVHNMAIGKVKGWRCTVCATVKPDGEVEKKK